MGINVKIAPDKATKSTKIKVIFSSKKIVLLIFVTRTVSLEQFFKAKFCLFDLMLRPFCLIRSVNGTFLFYMRNFIVAGKQN